MAGDRTHTVAHARGRQSQPAEGAALAAHAASKRKAAGIELTHDNESHIRSLLAEINLEAEQPRPTKGITAADIIEVFKLLLSYGFHQQHIKNALQTLAGGDISEETALDWLCLNVDSADLPKRFAGGAVSRAAGARVKVLAKAEKRTPSGPRVPADPLGKQQEERILAREAHQAQVASEKEKESQRAWILNYMKDESSETESVKSEDPGIEDWEVWGDPREIERRKAERRKAGIPSSVRKSQLAEEWAHAKAGAATAKAAGDKARQKAFGCVIRDLKQEIKQRGFSEEDLESIVPSGQAEKPSRTRDDGDAGTSNLTHVRPPAESEQCTLAADHQALVAQAGSSSPSACHEGAVTDELEARAAPEGSSASAEDSDLDLEASMFDEDVALATPPPQPGAAQPRVRPAVLPWGIHAQKAQTRNRRGASGVEQPASKAPKALLQQLCQREGRAPPRFEKLAPGGNRLPHAGIRYGVVVEAAPRNGRGPKAKLAKRRQFGLREDQDGWDTIQAAQNGVAALALYEITSDKTMWHELPEPYQQLWTEWESTGAGAHDTDDADIMAFATALVSATPPALQAESPATDYIPARASQACSPGVVKKDGRRVAEDGERMRKGLQDFRDSVIGQQWTSHRCALPVHEICDDLLQALRTQDVVVVGGDTGCGKTTQVPQYLLDASIELGLGGECNVICTQPRRIAAISVAERVCQERGEMGPGEKGSAVGYHVRLDNASNRDTKLLFCTTGILLRRMASDPRLSAVTHVVVDEVHERSMQGDFLMALLKDIVTSRRASGSPLKVVLMSATLNSNQLADYFGGCPTLRASGRTFPVVSHFLEDIYELIDYRLDPDSRAALRGHADRPKSRAFQKTTGPKGALLRGGWGDDEADLGASNRFYDPTLYDAYSQKTRKNLMQLNENEIDYDLLEDLVTHLLASAEDGAILVFLPGLGEITTASDRLSELPAARSRAMRIFALHSSVSASEQHRAFDVLPAGVRKIVLATNIAETSLTIADVCFVIDSGKLKERRYDALRGMSLLVEDWISRANAMQRKGRAGRVRPGHCYALYTRDRFERRMRKFQAAEMVRIPLEELVLQIHVLQLGRAADFLTKVIEPPPAKSVQAAVTQLQSLGALDADEGLTALGHHLAQLPVDARIGKLLLVASTLGCLAPVLTIAACLSYKTPFAGSIDQQSAVQQAKATMAAKGGSSLASGQQSDHLLMAATYQAWQQARAQGGRRQGKAYAQQHLLDPQTLETIADIRGQYAAMLADMRYITRTVAATHHRPSENWFDDVAQPFNVQRHQAALIKAVLCAGLYPNVAVMDAPGGLASRPSWNDGKSEAHIHPSSLLHPLEAQQFHRPYLVYLEKVKTSRIFLRDCSVVSPMAVLLFGGNLDVRHDEGITIVDGWIRVRAAAPTAVLVKKLRDALDTLLSQKIKSPAFDLSGRGVELVQILARMLADDEKSAQQLW